MNPAGCEGIVVKHSKSLYTAGFKECLTNPLWIKVKKDEPHLRRGKRCSVASVASSLPCSLRNAKAP
jgi:ATP-dependent DNA ligase